jgi:drug/metabolite transporter (DMT)-like permease
VTASIATGLGLALGASLALNTGFLLQHNGATQAPPVNPLKPIATVVGLLRRRIWLLGLVLGTSGWALHVAALSRAPLSLVQAFVAGGLALLAPVATRWFGQRLSRAESAAVAVMAFGLAALALGIHEPRELAYPGLGLGVFLAGCAVAAVVIALQRAAVPLAVAAGLLYGAADTAIKALTIVDSRHGLGAALLSAWLLAAVLATAGAFFAFQRALQVGRPVTAIALMTAATYAVSIAAGIALLGEPLGHGVTGVVHAAAFAAVVAAAWVLAPVQARVTTA